MIDFLKSYGIWILLGAGLLVLLARAHRSHAGASHAGHPHEDGKAKVEATGTHAGHDHQGGCCG